MSPSASTPSAAPVAPTWARWQGFAVDVAHAFPLAGRWTASLCEEARLGDNFEPVPSPMSTVDDAIVYCGGCLAASASPALPELTGWAPGEIVEAFGS